MILDLEPATLLPRLAALAILVALDAYVLLGGADFGGGVWDLLASGPRRDRQRSLIADAIGPIWEANHVWLILVVVLLFTAFPAAFARLSIALHIPLAVMLVGIVLRGSAFTFRSYDSRRDAVQRRWGLIFSVASVVTPITLGMIVGTIASGRVADVVGWTGRGARIEATFADVYVRPWLSPFPLAVGGLALALFAFLAAVYLVVEADGDALREDFRRRALGAAAAVFATAALALVAAHLDPGPSSPHVRDALLRETPGRVLQAATAAAALSAIAALYRRRYRLARVAAAAQVSLILWGWAIAQFPYVVPPDLTITAAAAPEPTLALLLAALALGLVVLVPSLGYLVRVFKRGEA